MNSKLLGESTVLYPSPSTQPPPYIDIVTLNTMSHKKKEYTVLFFVPSIIVMATRVHCLTINVNMGHNQLFAKITYRANSSTGSGVPQLIRGLMEGWQEMQKEACLQLTKGALTQQGFRQVR